jgi:excisionase family DNA binding protein
MQKHLSLLEAGPLLGVSPYTLRAWVREGRIPYIRVGRRIVFDPRDLEAFVQAARINSSPKKRA